MVAERKVALQVVGDAGAGAAFPQAETICLDRRAFTTLSTREEAEYLLVLDHSRGGCDTEWTAFFVECMVEFLIWQREPWGLIREDDLDWLIGLTADAPSPSVAPLLFALVRELNGAPERLTALALKHARGRLA